MHPEPSRNVVEPRSRAILGASQVLVLLAVAGVPCASALDLTRDRVATDVDATIVGDHEAHRLGFAMATGDWNGDGIDDLAVAGPSSAVSSPPHSGSVAIFFGGARLPALTDLATESPDVLIVGSQAHSQFGWRVHALDWNGDGVDDLVVGANAFDRIGSSGAVSVFFGQAVWPATWDAAATPEDVRILGFIPDENFGHAFASGDFNGDGVEDLAAQSLGFDFLHPRFQAGIVRVFFGRAAFPGTWDLGVTPPDVTILGAERADALGGTFGLDAGDLDGDGLVDLAIASHRQDSISCVSCGVAHVFRGRPIWPAEIDLAIADADMSVHGTERNCFGCGLGVGDVSGDGAPDLIIGGDSIRALLGPFTFPRVIDLATEPADRVIRPAPGDALGKPLAVRDLDDDGVGDLLAHHADDRVLLLSGASWTAPAINLATDEPCCHLVEIPRAQRAVEAGDWDADGSTDLAFGTRRGTHSALFTPGDARILYGCLDAEPPTFDAVALDGACLWPPMHGYVCADLSVAGISVSDDCSAAEEIRLRIVDAFSDQPDDSGGRGAPRGGDGHSIRDVLLAPDGSSAYLRAERIGDRDEGRTYTLVLEAVDAHARVSLHAITVHVPRDQREHPDCLRSAPPSERASPPPRVSRRRR